PPPSTPPPPPPGPRPGGFPAGGGSGGATAPRWRSEECGRRGPTSRSARTTEGTISACLSRTAISPPVSST
ncbi:MAG: phosphopeptide-binding protein, partial [Gemmatimonadetes bacterium]|nr:phosphopeptide-binding protein [Gemmatimonadota bacterium]